MTGGRDGTGYALEGDNSQDGQVWWQTTSDSLPNDISSISFWHYAVEQGSTDIPQLMRIGSSGSYFAMDLTSTNKQYYIANGR